MVRGQQEIAKELLQYIDAENLPKEYGGACSCPGGCAGGSLYEKRLVDYVARLNEGPEMIQELERLRDLFEQELD